MVRLYNTVCHELPVGFDGNLDPTHADLEAPRDKAAEMARGSDDCPSQRGRMLFTDKPTRRITRVSLANTKSTRSLVGLVLPHAFQDRRSPTRWDSANLN